MTSTQHILCIFLPHWSITRRLRRCPEYRNVPVVVVRSIGQRRLVIDASPLAASQGIRSGMSAAEARALCLNLYCIDEDISGDQRALAALGRWMIRFTPVVSCGWDDADPDNAPAVLFLDLTGSERCFGGMDRLVHHVKRSLQRFDILARMALAPTHGAAWAFALTGTDVPTIIDSASFSTSLEPLPIESLRLNDEMLDNLRHLGLHCVRDLLALPREQLPSRFGSLLLKRLDQLTGALIEPPTKLLSLPPVSSCMEFDASVESLEDIWRIFEKLLNRVLGDLVRQNRGVRQMRILLKPDRGWGLPTITRTIVLSRSHCDRATLLELIRGQTERIDCEHGFVRFQLDITLHERITRAQAQLFEQQTAEEQMELDRLLQRLQARLSDGGVVRPGWVESYLPERNWRPGEQNASASNTIAMPSRPVTLFSSPLEILVICEPSDDRTGQPRQFTWKQGVHRLAHAMGPERIAGEWWRGHHYTRDYYAAEDEAGERFWLVRVTNSHGDDPAATRWFLHGRFD